MPQLLQLYSLNLLQGFQTQKSSNRVHDCNNNLQQSLLYKGILTQSQYHLSQPEEKLQALQAIILFHKSWITFWIPSNFVTQGQQWIPSLTQQLSILKTCWCKETEHSSNEGSSDVNNDRIFHCIAIVLFHVRFQVFDEIQTLESRSCMHHCIAPIAMRKISKALS